MHGIQNRGIEISNVCCKGWKDNMNRKQTLPTKLQTEKKRGDKEQGNMETTDRQ